MQLTDSIHFVGLSVFLPASRTWVLSDIHIGYEEALNKQGVLVPRIYFQHLYEKTKSHLARLKPKVVVINGDLKHEFGSISQTEWRQTLQFIDLFRKQRLIIIKGNHDTILEPIVAKREIAVVSYHIVEKCLITHGDTIQETDEAYNTLIIGHEHPAITLKTKTRAETYKCFLSGTYLPHVTSSKQVNNSTNTSTYDSIKNTTKNPTSKMLIVAPSYNEITDGTNILREQLLSPYLKNQQLDTFNVHVCGKDAILDFGKISDIRKL